MQELLFLKNLNLKSLEKIYGTHLRKATSSTESTSAFRQFEEDMPQRKWHNPIA